MAETTADVRRDIELTRERMSDTLAQLEQKLNVTQIVRDHPWPALAAAVGAGFVLSGSKADVKAATATLAATQGASSKLGGVLDDVVAQLVSGLHGAFEERLTGLVDELKAAEIVAPEFEAQTVEDLLGALETGTGTTARLVDVPPLELEELRRSLAELRAQADELPAPAELAALYDGLRRTARAEGRSLLEVSTGVGLAFLVSARKLSREHVVLPYREDWEPLRREGFAAYARRVARPYGRAVAAHFDPERPTWTEKVLGRVSHDV